MGAMGGFSLSESVQDVGVHELNGSSVKEYAYSEDKNYRFRPYMEDSKRFFTPFLISISLCNQRQIGQRPLMWLILHI